MTGLAPGFKPFSFFEGNGYQLLPFKAIRLGGDKHVLTNIAGDYICLITDVYQKLVAHELQRAHPSFHDLKARHFITEGDPSAQLELLSTQYRTKQSHLAEFTALHIFVVTLRCDHSCQYCQVSRVSQDRAAFDMTAETAEKAVDLVFQSPSPYIKIEFQGGEPLLNFERIQQVVRLAKAKANGRTVEFIITSNLAFLTDEILGFAKEHGIKFSCSLDGPPAIHNQNRPRPGSNSYERTIEGISRIRQELGKDAVSALMTTTAGSLDSPETIIDEYVKQGFHSVFLRWISPFGFAVKSAQRIGYDTEEFLKFYKRGLDYTLNLNLSGVPMREAYAAIILRKILTPFQTGYVDLQSPSGLGLSVLVYNYDGDVYASDEARMLAEMGDKKFCLGSVHEKTYEQLFFDTSLLETTWDTVLEGIPGCSDCAFSPYCGTDPVYNYATQRDVIGHRPTSSFCRRNMEIIRHLFTILEENSERSRILRSWAR
jgi:uncharacterized protein